MAFLLLAMFYSLTMSRFSASQQISLPGCPSTCGNVTIHYPFGIGTSCSRSGFDLNCNHSTTPPKTYLMDNSNVEVLNISLLEGQTTVRYYRRSDCYSRDGLKMDNGYSQAGTGDYSPYTFSSLRNKFTVIGCDTYAYIRASNSSEFTSGCTTVCDRLDKLVNGSCFGLGCCQTAIPKGLKYYEILVNSYYNHTKVWDFNPCSYAFLMDQERFTFNVEDITNKSVYRSTVEQVPVVLDWVAGNQSCVEASRNNNSFACRSENSECYNSTSSATGYLCKCSSGYEGNPYLDGGCQDIDECQRLEVYPCKGECVNYPGSHECNCPKGTYGDARYGCTREKMPKKVILASVLLALVVTVLTICLYGIFEKRKRVRLAQQNGGTVLQEHLSTHKHIQSRFTIFTKEALEKATSKFDDRLVLGHGGQGKVYEGTLPDGTHIAIKKATQIDNSEKDDLVNRKRDFINEIIILTEIQHPNVVKLLGCCLEVDIPFLVYEFIPNKTLRHHIDRGRLSWKNRLCIAVGAAGALAHLHANAPKPIYHQDVKSANILLTMEYTAKISDFGISKLVSTAARATSKFVGGTRGYLDPDYIVSGELTGKTDVYSFGVVLAELLTGKLPLSKEQGNTTILAKLFKASVEQNKVLDILDPQIAEGATEAAIADMMHVAELAGQCLNFNGKDRPDMMVVFMKLEELRRSGYQHLVEHERAPETPSLPANQIPSVPLEEKSLLFDNTAFHSANAFDIEFGR